MPCSWQKEDYFSLLMSSDKRAYTALEMLVDDLHADKERTVNKFLCHSGSEDFLWGLVHLLGNDTARVAGNAAYILGTLAESEVGCMRVLSLVNGATTDSKRILPHLTRMLTFDDSESVMNAAGTMGTLAESHEGREWILSEKCLPQTLDHITSLLHSDNLWTASNAALVLARLSISEYGCSRMLDHEHSIHILSKLILSLGVDEAGRGMNAAFAIGRLCDMDQGRKRLLNLNDSERMISSLAKMLSCDDTGASKNACFALSCLATNSEGHTRLLNNKHSEEILRTLSGLLNAEDSETGWFAAMTLRTLASQPKGCLRLREHPQVISGLKSIENKDEVNLDLREEAIITLEILKRLPRPSPPIITVVSCNTVKATWEPIVTKSGFQVRYQLFDGTKCVYTGKHCECDVLGLVPNTAYVYKLRAYTEGDESPFSDIVSIITEESVPGPPQSVRILGATITQLKVGWDPPADLNGVMKGYYVFLDDKEVQHTLEYSLILTSLTANTNYEIQVCAATSKGRGEKAGVIGTTAEIGAHAPTKPHVNVIGRNELYISWGAPEVPLGRLNRYDVIMNDKIIYSGNDLNIPVRRLVPDTEYNFVVVALTSEGKFESKMAKKRTAKDEYDQARPPLYQPPKKESASVEEGSKTPTSQHPQKKRKSSASRVSSAKQNSRRVSTGKERVKSSSTGIEPRPSSDPYSGTHGDSRRYNVASSVTSLQEAPVSVTMTTEKPVSSSPPPPHHNSYVNHSPAESSTPSPAGRPVAEVKFEAPPSKTRTPRSLNKIERPTHSANVQQRVLISTVSMQNSKTENSGDSKIGDSSVSGKKITGKVEKDLPSAGNNLRIERSKTMFSGRELRNRGKYSNITQNNRVENETRTSKDFGDSMRNQRSRPNTNDRDQNSVGVIKDRGKTKFGDEVNNKQELQIVSKDKDILKLSHGNTRERSSRGHHGSSHDRGRSRESLKGPKDPNLPKPSLPSQKYLEGTPVHSDSSPWGARSSFSDKSSRDQMDSDWLTQVKSVSENYSRPPAHNHALQTPADSTYFIDSSQYLQRTNTYISSHRRRRLEPLPESPSDPGFDYNLNPYPGFTPDNTRPVVGRRSLDKLQKTSSSVKVNMQAKLGSSMNFEMDIPEHNQNKLANKFIPMQLRTQPSNLGIGQLQRMNTTLMGDLTGDNSVSFKRVEAMTRSQTQVDMRAPNQTQMDMRAPNQNQGDTRAPNQHQIPIENRRDVPLSNKDRSQNVRKMSSGSQPKVHKLGGNAAGGTNRSREPDSMLLQQSWGINSGSDLAALQNVR